MAAAPPGLAAAGMAVDEESPAERLRRLEEAVRQARRAHRMGSIPYLEAAAALAWEVAEQACDRLDAAKDEQEKADKEGDDDEKAAAAEKVELAGAEAELAQAKAELAQAEAKLAQAEADGDKDAAKALIADKAALQAEVTRLKTQHPPPALAGERPAKRLRFDPARYEAKALAEVPELVGRDDALREIRTTILSNADNHGRKEMRASQGILAAVGHVRVGKTRLAFETVRAIEEMRADVQSAAGREWMAPVLLTVDFQNGSNFVPALDGRAVDDVRQWGLASELLGVRVANAAGALCRGGTPTKLKQCNLDEVSPDVSVGKVISALVRELTRGHAGQRVPIVLHLDEYGYLVRDMEAGSASDEERRARNKFAVEVLLQMVRRIGNDLMLCDDVDDDVRDKFFVVPIVTGTSFHDVRLHPTGFSVHYLPTPLLTFDQSVELLKGFWKLRKDGDEFKLPDIKTPKHKALLVALSDTAGFPGLVRMVAGVTPEILETLEVQKHLLSEVKSYVHPVEPPGAELWALVVRLILARQKLTRNTLVQYRDPNGELRVRLVGDLVDKGYASTVPSDGTPLCSTFTLATAMSLMQAWGLTPGVFYLGAVPNTTVSAPWTWQQFEIMYANYAAAILAAMFELARTHAADVAMTVPDGVRPDRGQQLVAAPPTLGRLLRGARATRGPSTALLACELVDGPARLPWGEPSGDKGIVRDKKHVLHAVSRKKKRVYKKDTVPFDMDGVHLCADGNPVVDAYVNLVVDKRPATVFYQFKHSKLGRDGPIPLAQLNEDRQRLDEYLKPRSKEWRERLSVLVYVTNRIVTCAPGVELLPLVFYISREELTQHLGPEFAGRGLVPMAVARRE